MAGQRSRRMRRGTAHLLAYLTALVALAMSSGLTGAHASVALLLEMPYGRLGRFNPTGHTALYFDHICAATPLRLRPCAPGELGAVISRYNGIGGYDRVAVPLIPYLYGVETAAEIPSTMDELTELRTRDLYRREHLQSVASDTPEGGMPQGSWYELIGTAYDRTVYGFEVKTTPEQDAMLVDMFNDRPNVTRYNGAFRNCADFAREVLNRLYPHAVRRNYVADFGLTTPKSVARGLVHTARRHPEMGLTVFQVAQVPGSIRRSGSIQGVTGSLLTKYVLPMTLVSPYLTAGVAVGYLGKGRFAMPKNAPLLDLAERQTASASQAGWAAVESALDEGAPLTPTQLPAPPTANVSSRGSNGDPVRWPDGGALPSLLFSDLACALCSTMPFHP